VKIAKPVTRRPARSITDARSPVAASEDDTIKKGILSTAFAIASNPAFNRLFAVTTSLQEILIEKEFTECNTFTVNYFYLY
jgi:hypothetical protein